MDSIKNSVEEFFAFPISSDLIPGSEMVIEWGKGIGSWFWSESFWTPVGYSWEDLNQEKIPGYPDHRDIVTYPVLFSIIFLVLKNMIIQPLIISPLSHKLGLPNRKHRKPVQNKLLENLYNQYGATLPRDVMVETSNSLQWTSREIERWLRRKKASLKLTVHQKFVDNIYTWLYKVGIFTFGVYVLHDKSYGRDFGKFFENFPEQGVDEGIWWLYMLGVSFCISQTINIASQPINKESVVFLVHHIITFSLLTFSWVVNGVRGGSVVLLLHEVNDTLLLLGKAFKYMNYEKSTDVCFALFVVSWIVSRLYMFPMYILKPVFYELPPHMSEVPALYLFQILLAGIFFLNVNWSVMIGAMIVRKLTQGEVKDIRSSEEYDSEDETEYLTDKKPLNGKGITDSSG